MVWNEANLTEREVSLEKIYKALLPNEPHKTWCEHGKKWESCNPNQENTASHVMWERKSWKKCPHVDGHQGCDRM